MVPFVCSNFICQFNPAMIIPQLSMAIDSINPSLLGIMGNIGLLFHANGTSNVLLFQMNQTLLYEITPFKQFVQNGQSIGAFKYSYNGDYDGDCLTDLILLKENGTNTILQFIRGNETNQFRFIKQIVIHKKIQHFTVQDISNHFINEDFDGKNDLILLLASSQLQVHYHRYGTDKLLCKGLDFNEIPYDFEISQIQTRQIQRIQLSSPLYPHSLLLFGDFNNDGYEDLSLTLMDKTGTFPQAVLLQNVGCNGLSCGNYNPLFIQESLTLNLRTFTQKTISGINQVSSRLSFIDILQDGNLDFMFHMQVDLSGVKYMTIQAVYNNIDYDAFFLTITILTAKTTKNNLFDNTQYIGGVTSFFVTLLSGQLAPKTANQLAQGGTTLQLPYIRQGLGRTNNYLQDLTITIPRSPFSQFLWTPIIPNSDILIVPPPLDSPNSEWTLNVLIEPTQKLGFVLLLVIVSLGAIGAVILNLSRKQKQEDKQTQEMGDRAIKKSDIATVKFDMNQQKVVKPESSTIYSKELKQGRGTLQYKFINLKTKTINKSQFQMNRQRRTQLEIQQSKDENSFKIDQLMKFLVQKDQLIQKLQKKVESLIIENKKKNQSPERDPSKQKAISLHVKVNTANDTIRRENEKLIIRLRQMQQKIQEAQRKADFFQQQKNNQERQVERLKKQIEQYKKMYDSRIQVKRRTGSFIGPSSGSFIGPSSFVKNGNDNYSMNQSNADWLQSQQNPTKITINEPIKRPSLIHQDSDISNSPKRTNSHQQKLKSRASMFASSYLPVSNDLQKQKSELDRNIGSHDNIDQAALQKRISSKKEDFKWNSMLFEREQQIQILKKKLQLKTIQAKENEKQLEKYVGQLKKKQSQIKQMKRQSRKNLLFGQIGTVKQLGKNNSDMVKQYDRIQAEHDSQKLRLDQKNQKLQQELKDREKQLKNIKANLQQMAERQKTIENKYASLKKFTQKKEEEFIQYKQKSQIYDLTNTRNKELEALLKSFESKCENYQKQNKRLLQMDNKLASRLKDANMDIDKYRRLQREYETAKNQNINNMRSIQAYEKQYTSLKRYCIQTQTALNKYMTSKKKGHSRTAQEDIKQEQEIQQKIVQFSIKMNQAQLNFYKQQIQDFNQQKKYINDYYERKLREDKDRILENKEMPNEQKKNIMVEKQKEVQKILLSKNQEIRTKIGRLQRLYEDANHRIVNKQDLDRPITEQLRIIEKKIQTFQQKQQQRIIQRKTLKETLQMLSQQLKKNNSSSYLQNQIQSQTFNRNSSVNPLLLSMLPTDTRPRNSLLQEARQRSEASQQKTYEQNRKMNTQLVKQNGDLKMKNQKLTIDIDKMERNLVQRQKKLQQTLRKAELQFKLKIQSCSEQIEKSTIQIQKLKQQLADSSNAVIKISEQATILSYDLQSKQKQIQDLEQKIVSYELRMEEYEKSERMMLDEVSEIKKNSQQNKQQLFLLIQQRSNNFSRIEQLKEKQLQKLKHIISQLQVKLQAEMFQNIKSKERIQQIKEKYDKLEKQTQEKLVNQKLDLQNKQAEYDKLYMKQYHTSKENQILQENLMDISTQIQNKQVDIATLTYQLTKLNKELAVYKDQSQRFQSLQIRYKDDIRGLQLLLDDKVAQIKHFQEKYRQLQINVQYSAKDLERLSIGNIKAENSMKEYQDKYMAKQEEIIMIKQEYSMLQIERQKQEMYYQSQTKQNQQLKQQITQLQREITKLKETPVNNNSILKISRKVSQSEADKFDCPSPGRRKPTTKRLQIPQSSFIGGGITPIISSSQSPNLNLRITQNPFDPKESIRKTRTRKEPLNQTENKKEDKIEIHIESPMDFVKQKQNESNIEISLQQPDQSPRVSHKIINKPQQERHIKQQESNAQQSAGGFNHNIELGDSRQGESLEIHQYEEHIRELQRQLYHSNEENQKLNEELIEQSKKIDELMQQQQPNNSLSRTQQLGYLGASKRKLTLQFPSKQNNEKDNQNKLDNSRIDQHINRTSSNLDISRMGARQMVSNNSMAQLQEKYQAAQVEIQYLNDELQSMKNKLNQHVNNNQRLIQQAQLCRNTIQELNQGLEEAKFQIQQYKHFVQFQQLYNEQKQLIESLRNQIEGLNSQIFQKQAHIATLMNEQTQMVEQTNEIKGESVTLQENKGKLEDKVKQLTQIIKRLKIQYRKYEQSSELQIVRLNQTVDHLKMLLKEKNEEITQLGEQYLSLQNEKHNLASYIQQKQNNVHKKDYQFKRLQNRCNQLEQQSSKTEQKRQVLFKRIKDLQNQINQRDERVKNVSGESGLLVKKYEIKLQSNRQQIQQLQSKLQQKQKTIIVLKNQISLYNDECLQLKQLNEQLNYQSTKIQKELKDIMTAYGEQIQSYKSVITSQQLQINNFKSIIKEKQDENHALLKNIRAVEKQRENYRYESLDYKNNLQKTRNNKSKENNQLNIQIQYKTSQCQRLKASIEQLKQQIDSKGQNINELKQKYQIRLKNYREKLQKYQSMMDQFQNDLKKVEGRPTVQLHEEILFQNQMLKNRIDELQEQINIKNDNKDKQQTIYIEFRKYKANKQRQIQDLQAEMDKYGNKINQLQETTFLLKKQNQNLKQEMYSLSEAKDQLHTQCDDLRQNLSQVEQQLQFYKKRKILDMQKLLNDTQ